MEKWQQLIKEDRPMTIRLALAGLVMFMAVFTFLFFGPIELFMANGKSFNFTLGDMVAPMSLTALTALVLGTAFLLLWRGALFDYVVTFAFGLSLCGYLQGNYLNLDLGILDGSSIAWEEYTVHALTNLLVWLLVLVFLYFLYYMNKRIWRLVLQGGALLLILMQTVGLVVLLIMVPAPAPTDGYLATDEMFCLSANSNVVVFVLDFFDNKYLASLLESEPDYLAPLKGFTRYRNITGYYARTFPALPFLLTATEVDFSVPTEEFLARAHGEATFLRDMKGQGYHNRLFFNVPNGAGQVDNLVGQADNLAYSTKSLAAAGFVKEMVKLSAYRYVPHALKPSFWLYTNDLNQFVITAADEAYAINDPLYFARLRDEGLRLTDEPGAFLFYHLNGAHYPYRMDAMAQAAPEGSNMVEQCKGALYIVYEYIRQMKELGIFDAATIIITADHGSLDADQFLEVTSPIFFMKPGGQDDSQDLRISGAPVSHKDFHATVLYAAGGDAAAYGEAIQEIPEEAVRTRYFYNHKRALDGSTGDGFLHLYRVDGDANDLANWTFLEAIEILYPFYK